MIYGDSNNGQNSLVNVSRVSNGWLVVVYHANRDKEVSPETAAKRDAELQQQIADQKDREKKRIVRELTLQLANMAIIGEAAGKAQYKGVQDELEPWKRDEDEDEDQERAEDDAPKGALEKIEALAEKLANESSTGVPAGLGNFLGLFGKSHSEVETHIFTERDKMVAFVTQMLQPIVE